jgi:tetratricopeptide (TPR) repeat protein
MGIWRHWAAGLIAIASRLIARRWEQFGSETRGGLVQRALDRLEPLETWLIRILGRGLLRNRLPAEQWAQASLVVAQSLFERQRHGRALTVAQESAANSKDPALLMRAHGLIGLCYDWMRRSESGEPIDEPSRQIVQYERAISFAQEAGDRDFEAGVTVWLSTAKKEQQEVEQAFALVERWSGDAELKPNTRGLVNFKLGVLYWTCRDDPQRARSCLHKATNLLNDDSHYILSQAYYWLSEAEWAIGDAMAAFASAQAALRHAHSRPFPGDFRVPIHYWLGHLYFEVDSLEDSVWHFYRYLALKTVDVNGRASAQLGVALFRLGRRRRAETYLRAALESGRLDAGPLSSVLGHLGMLMAAKRRYREAIGLYSLALEKLNSECDDERIGLCKRLGHSYFWLKEYERAAKFYRQGLRMADADHPDRAELLEALVYTNEWKAWHDARSS